MGKKRGGNDQLVGGLIVLGIGVLFLLIELDLIPNLGKMWPLFPIIVGLAMVLGSFRRSGSPADGSHQPDAGSGES